MQTNLPQELTSGEVLKATGLSKKELQALDELGILQPQPQLRKGIRHYDQQTLMRIAQFSFYEAMQVPLEVTREILAASGLQRADAVLDAQWMLLYTRLDELNTRIAIVEAAQELERIGKTVPWGALTRMEHELPGADLNFWEHFQPETVSGQSAYYSFDDIWQLYQTWKRLLISAALDAQSGVLPEELLAKSLGLAWLNWRREVESMGLDLKEVFDKLETSETWLRQPPFANVFDWLAKVEQGL